MSIVYIASLVGCAAHPAYQNYTATDAACIKGSDVVVSFNGEGSVFIKEIDGIPTGTSESYCFAPGKHRLGVSAHARYQSVHDYVDLDFNAGRSHALRANLRGTSFAFQLVDITSQSEKGLADFRLEADSTNLRTVVPILVPAK